MQTIAAKAALGRAVCLDLCGRHTRGTTVCGRRDTLRRQVLCLLSQALPHLRPTLKQSMLVMVLLGSEGSVHLGSGILGPPLRTLVGLTMHL